MKKKRKNKNTTSNLEFLYRRGSFLNSKHAQLTIFIILAIVIIAILLILIYPKLKTIIAGPVPADYIERCIEDSTKEVLKKLEMQGGTLNPENYILYQGNKIDYICYTNEYYKRCMMQKPFLKQDIEEEITSFIEPRVNECLNNLKSELEKKGSSVSLGKMNIKTTIVPNYIGVTVNVRMTVTKEGTESFDKFKVNIPSQLYDLIMLSSSIANYEARYGDSDTLTYMLYYPDIRVEKKKQSEGSTVYILTNKLTNEKFQFASRSLAWPSGYIG